MDRTRPTCISQGHGHGSHASRTPMERTRPALPWNARVPRAFLKAKSKQTKTYALAALLLPDYFQPMN